MFFFPFFLRKLFCLVFVIMGEVRTSVQDSERFPPSFHYVVIPVLVAVDEVRASSKKTG